MKKSVHILFVAAVSTFLLSVITATFACEPEDCEPCYEWDPDANGGNGDCVWQCDSGDACCEDGDGGGECCMSSSYCCGNACQECCHNSQCTGCKNCISYQCEDDDNNCTGCKSCSNGQCIDDDGNCTGCESCNNGQCEDDDDNCSGVQSCISSECKCDDSDQEPEEIANYDYDLSGLLSGIESAINAIPKLEVQDGLSLEINITATKEKKCCSPEDESFTEEIKLEGSGSISGTILIDILGTKDFHFEETWDGYGSINADLALDIGPSVSLGASASVSGIISGCNSICLAASGGANITITIVISGTGQVTVTCEETWLWDEFDLSVGFSASGSASTSASAAGTYYIGDGCEEEGFVVGCCQIGQLTVSASLSFEVGPWSYEVDSGDIGIWDGWDNGKC